METTYKLDALPPRFLRYRTHYKVYLIMMLTLAGLVLSFWGFRISKDSFSIIYQELSYELWISCCYFALILSFYFFWLKKKLHHSVQVFSDRICLHHGPIKKEILFSDIESVGIVCWSLFYFKMQTGTKYYFSSSLERVDYIWEGVHNVRPGLTSDTEYENFRLKLVQYDHHQKRKEWFFRHKLVDIFNWIVIPIVFLGVAYAIQSRDVIIYHQGLYFFRLLMYSLLVLIFTTFFFSMVLKKFLFDKRIRIQMGQSDEKLRDVEFEGVILQKSKMLQMITTCFIFAVVISSEVNLFSITKVKENLDNFELKKGNTLLVDNRYNCIVCKYPINEGDLVVFERGFVGQIMAKEGDMVGLISQDGTGRTIASENVKEVPRGHLAIKLANQKEVVMVKLSDLIGKIQK